MSPRRRRRRTLLRVVVAAELLYALGASWYLNSSDLRRRIDRRPEVFRFDYDLAWTVVPFWVSLRGVRLAGTTRRTTWTAAVDRAGLLIDPLSLPARVFHVALVRGRGATVEIDRRPPDAPPPPPAPAGAGRWTVRFSHGSIADLETLRFGDIQVRGRATLGGGFQRTRPLIELDRLRLDLVDTVVERRGTPWLRHVSGRVELSSDPFDPRRHRGRLAIPFLDLEAHLDGEGAGLEVLMPYLRQGTAMVDLAGGEGRFVASVALRRGRLEPGSFVEVKAPDVAVSFSGYRASGAAQIRLDATAEGASWGGGELVVRFSDYALRREGFGEPHVRGRGVVVRATLVAPPLEGPRPALRQQLAEIQGSIDLPRAEVPRLTFYNGYLPRRIPLEILRGRATTSTHVEVRGAGGLAATMDLRTIDGALRFEDIAVEGDVHLATKVRRPSLMDGVMRIDGTTLSLRHVEVDEVEGERAGDEGKGDDWGADVEVLAGCLDPGKDPFLWAAIRARLDDIRPVLEVVAAGTKLPRWTAKLFRKDDVEARAYLVAGKAYTVLSDIIVDGGTWGLEGDLRLSRGAKEGGMIANYRRLKVGIELPGGGRKTKIRLRLGELRARLAALRRRVPALAGCPGIPEAGTRPPR